MIHTTTPAIFRSTVHAYGDRVALRKKEFGLWRDISWKEYYGAVRAIGCAFLSTGLARGEGVAIIGDNCAEWVMVDLGIQCVGGISVGIYATNAWPQVEYVVNHSESRFFFVENEEQLDKWLRFREQTIRLEKVIVWDTKGLKGFSDPMVLTFNEWIRIGEAYNEAHPGIFEERSEAVKTDDVAVLIYTSGTTGPPKGAMLTHGNVTFMAQAICEANPVHDSDEVLSFLPLCHIFERLFSVFAHIAHGYTVNFIERPDTVTDNMIEISPTVGYAVPRIWEKYYSLIYIRMSEATPLKRMLYSIATKIGMKRTLLGMTHLNIPLYLEGLYRLFHFIVFRKLKERIGFDRMRVAYSGAAPISPDVLKFFHSIGINLIEGYGQTEATGVTCTSRLGKMKFGTVGLPLPGVTVIIAADGEILVKSPGVFSGYFKDSKATQAAILDGWLHSGDVGKLDEDGFLTITDRKKDIIVTAGGKNITPQYIENKLKMSPYITDAVVIGDNRKFIVGLIMIDEEPAVKYAQDQKIQFSTYKDLTQHLEIQKLIRKEVDAVNKTLSRVEQIKKFTILPKKLYEEDGEVTPTMKVKRKFVYKTYSNLIEEMYRKE